jgi:cytochrome c5
MKSSDVWRRFSVSLSAFALLALIFVGCSKNIETSADLLYVPTAADATATATLADLQAGRSIYINSCGKCHNLFTPGTFSTSVVSNMATRAALTATQTSQVTKYITRGK